MIFRVSAEVKSHSSGTKSMYLEIVASKDENQCDLFYDSNGFCVGPMSGTIIERFVCCDNIIPRQNDEVIVGQSIAIGHHLRSFNGEAQSPHSWLRVMSFMMPFN